MTYRCTAIVPVYNTDPIMLRQALASITTQDEPVTAVIVDDGSSDRATRDELTSWAIQKPEWVILRNRFNRGAAFARNRALKHVETAYTALLDSDDIWANNKISQQLISLGDGLSVANICLTRIRRTTDGFSSIKIEAVTPYPLLDELVSYKYDWYRAYVMLSRFNAAVCGSNAVFATDALRRVGGFSKEWSGLDEWVALLEVLRGNPFAEALTVSTRAEVTYRRHKRSYSQVNKDLLRYKVEDYIAVNRKRMTDDQLHFLESPEVAIWARKLSQAIEYEPGERGLPGYGGL